MNKDKQPGKNPPRDYQSWRTASTLAATALLCSTVLVMTYKVAQPQIAMQQAAYLQSQLSEVLPAELYNNDLSADTVILISDELGNNELGSETGQTAWRARMNDTPVAAILTVTAPGGYAGPITLLLGVLTNGKVQGVRVISHRETPGLGDGIEAIKSDWIKDFEQHSLNSLDSVQWQVKKDGGVFEHFTGATITPRAVTSAIYRALKYFERNQEHVFATDH